MKKNQVINAIQTRLGDKLWNEDFHELNRSAKNALKKRVESGDYFGKVFHRLLDIFEICGLEVVDKDGGECEGGETNQGDVE